MRRTAAAAAAVIVPLLAVPLVPMASASAAAPYKGANTAAVQDDFNGDGYRDLAVGAPGAANGSVGQAGAVVVLYGSASSVSAERRQVISQATPGIPGTPEAYDAFGAMVASADLDRDGYADLVVGVPKEKVGDKAEWGAVTVVWGGPDGLSGGATVPTPARYGESATRCGFGMALATGDMNGDGAPELTVGSWCGGSSYTGPFSRTGAAASSYVDERLGPIRGVAMGDVDGDGKAERFLMPGPVAGDFRGPLWRDAGAPAADDPSADRPVAMTGARGWIGRIGDVNGDGYGDLVTGVPGDDSLAGEPSGAHRGGEIQVLYGSAQGIAADQQPQVIHQDTPGVPGTGEDGDLFGQSLSVGDVDGDGYADVLVGAPGESVGKATGAGMAVLLRGSAAGLTGAGAAAYTQNVAGIPGAAETGDDFGRAVHLADLTGDGKAEPVVGVPGENDCGGFWTARGSASGPVLTGSAGITGLDAGIALLHSQDAYFGAALTSADLP